MEIEKAHNIPRETLLTNNKTIKERKLPIIMTYNKSLPNIKKAIDDNWLILSINQTISENFHEKPRITCRTNKNLGNILGRQFLENIFLNIHLFTCFGRLVHLQNFRSKLYKIFNLHILNFTSQVFTINLNHITKDKTIGNEKIIKIEII